MPKLIIASIVLIGIQFAACGGDDKASWSAYPASVPTTVATISTGFGLTYEVAELSSDGELVAILISPEEVNDEDMAALGAQLNRLMAAEDFAFIFVFDDAQAAELRQRVANDEATEAELALYDRHFVGRYGKNDATGFDEFLYYLDGVGGTQQKSIEY